MNGSSKRTERAVGLIAVLPDIREIVDHFWEDDGRDMQFIDEMADTLALGDEAALAAFIEKHNLPWRKP